MKTIALILTYLISLNAFAGAPLGVKGQNDTAKQYPPVISVPNKQATKITGGTLLETGNKNRLKNPGFESSVSPAADWDIATTGTAVHGFFGYSTPAIEGKNSLQFSCSGGASGGTCTVSQDVATSYRVQGLSSIFVDSDSATGVKVFSRVDAVNSQSVNVETLDPAIFKVPVIFGTTSTGIAVEITVAASQTINVLLDEGFVGAQDLKQDINVIGGVQDYTPVVTTSTGTITNYTATGKWHQEGQFLVGQVKLTFSSTTGTWTGPTISIPSGYTIDTSKLIYANPDIGKVTALDTGVKAYQGGRVAVLSTTTILLESIAVVIHTGAAPAEGSNFSGSSPFTFNAGDFIEATYKVPVTQFSASTSIYSTTADYFSTDSITLVHKATAIVDSDPVGTFNTYSYAINTNTKTICGSAPTQTIADMKTNGIQIFTRAYNAPSTCGAPARVEVKIGKGMTTIQKDLYKSAAKAISGNTDLIVNGTDSSGFYMKEYEGSTGILVMDSGVAISTGVTSASFRFNDITTQTSGYLVINAQKKKDFILGDFIEQMRTPGVSKPETFSVSYGTTNATTACSANPCSYVDQIGNAVTSISWGGTGSYTMNLAKTYTKLKCMITIGQTTGGDIGVPYNATGCSNCSAFAFQSRLSTTTASANSYGTVMCQGYAP